MSAISTAVAPKFRPIPNNQLRIPTGGFRSETLRDQKIIAHIESKPGFTCREYADQMDIMAFEVNETIFQTRQGRQLAERGLIRVPARGKPPRWAGIVINQAALTKRLRENQYPLIAIDGIADGDILGKSLLQMQMARQFQMHSSPRIRRQLIAAADTQTTEVAIAFSTLKVNMAALITAATHEAVSKVMADLQTGKAPTVIVPAVLEIQGPSPSH